jgi:hypothetical protein
MLPEHDLSRTFAGFREAVREHADAPPAAAIRSRAEHQVRVRRTTTALLAAAAVAVVAVGGGAALRDSAPPRPVPPGETATPTPGPSVTDNRRPTKPVPTTRANAISDPIGKVNWLSATIDIPRENGCPVGDVRFRLQPNDVIPPPTPTNAWSGEAFPRIYLYSSTVAYGDLLGDGRPEAVIVASCLADREDSGDGSGRLLVVTRESSGKLRGVAWVGQRGAIYNGQWITQRRLYTDTAPWHVPWDYSIGQARAYEWGGDRFVERDVRDEFPGLVPVGSRPGTPVDLSSVTALLRCAAGTVLPAGSGLADMRFDAQSRAIVDGVTWSAQQRLGPDTLQHLVDLDGDGRRRLLLELSCGEGAGGGGQGVPNIVLLERVGNTYRGVDVLIPPDTTRDEEYAGWSVRGRELTVTYPHPSRVFRYVWNGEYFQEDLSSRPCPLQPCSLTRGR